MLTNRYLKNILLLHQPPFSSQRSTMRYVKHENVDSHHVLLTFAPRENRRESDTAPRHWPERVPRAPLPCDVSFSLHMWRLNCHVSLPRQLPRLARCSLAWECRLGKEGRGHGSTAEFSAARTFSPVSNLRATAPFLVGHLPNRLASSFPNVAAVTMSYMMVNFLTNFTSCGFVVFSKP